MQNPVKIIPGFALTVAIAMIGIQFTKWIIVLLNLAKSPVSAIMMAIVLGIIVRKLAVLGIKWVWRMGEEPCQPAKQDNKS